MTKFAYAALLIGLTSTAVSAQAPTPPTPIAPVDQGYITEITQAFGTVEAPTTLATDMKALVTDWAATYQGNWLALQTALQTFYNSCSTQSAPDGNGSQLVCGTYVCGTDNYTACNTSLGDLNTQLSTITKGITLIENPPASSDVSQAVAAAEGMQIIYNAIVQAQTDVASIKSNSVVGAMHKGAPAPKKAR